MGAYYSSEQTSSTDKERSKETKSSSVPHFQCLAIIGQRKSGRSTLARVLAKRVNVPHYVIGLDNHTVEELEVLSRPKEPRLFILDELSPCDRNYAATILSKNSQHRSIWIAHATRHLPDACGSQVEHYLYMRCFEDPQCRTLPRGRALWYNGKTCQRQVIAFPHDAAPERATVPNPKGNPDIKIQWYIKGEPRPKDEPIVLPKHLKCE